METSLFANICIAAFLILVVYALLKWKPAPEEKAISRKCLDDFYGLENQIRFCPTLTGLAAFSERIVDFEQQYAKVTDAENLKTFVKDLHNAIDARFIMLKAFPGTHNNIGNNLKQF